MSFQRITCCSQISAQPSEMTALRGEKYYRESEDDQGRLYCGWLQASGQIYFARVRGPKGNKIGLWGYSR